MNKLIRFLIIIVVLINLSSCVNNNTEQTEHIEKIDIGGQIWSGENLNTTKFRNGELIPEAKNLDEYFKFTQDQKPCWCYYDFDSQNDSVYGKLYNWYAVNDKRNIAPEGWRVASSSDWIQLITFLGGYDVAAGKLKSTEPNLWILQSDQINDAFGFSAKPGGFLHVISDMGDGFSSLKRVGAWWSSTEVNENMANSIWMYTGDEYSSETEMKVNEDLKHYAMSVRIILGTESKIAPAEKSSNEDKVETKVMTYKWCECSDMCYSLFVDEKGNEYNFGDISGQNNIDFQCYPNNSEGTVTDELREQKFKVTFIRVSKTDFELVKIVPAFQK
jgi:uncharacterized protein (TIGR02145 family)